MEIRRAAGDEFADEVKAQLEQGRRLVRSTQTSATFALPASPRNRNRGRWWPRLSRSRRAREITVIMEAPLEITKVLRPPTAGYGATLSERSERRNRHR